MKRRALLLALPACALAQTSKQQSVPIYRCGPGGRQISDKPCSADAAASSVRFDEPSEADRRAARDRAKTEAAQAEQLQREREARERQPSPAPQRLSPEPAPPEPAPKKSAGKAKKNAGQAKKNAGQAKKPSKPKKAAQPKRSRSKTP
jgi:hypothetical protein